MCPSIPSDPGTLITTQQFCCIPPLCSTILNLSCATGRRPFGKITPASDTTQPALRSHSRVLLAGIHGIISAIGLSLIWMPD
jgi:hypothetical protein